LSKGPFIELINQKMDNSQKTEHEQIAFFNVCKQGFLKAVAKTEEYKFYYNVAETTVCISFAGHSMIPLFTPALEHLRIQMVEKPDVTFYVWDSDSSQIEMAEPPCKWSDFTDRGDIKGFDSIRIKTAFHWGELSLVVMDLESNTGIFWVQSPSKLPFWTQSAPLRSLFHWWLEKNNMQLLHAAAIGTDDGAVLITGKGGVGKSSTAIRCLESGMYYLSDDYVIVQTEPEPVVYSLYSTAKIKKKEVDDYPLLKVCLAPYVKNKQEKELYLLFPLMKEKIVNKMPLKAILTPQIVDNEDSNIAPVPFWTVQAAMSFTTLSHLPYAGRYTHEIICNLCNKLPSFHLLLGKNRQKIPHVISGFISQIFDNLFIENKTSDTSKQKPLISVVIPVYNGEKFIKEAIGNVLSQNYPALEIIVVDDGSTDSTRKIIESLGIDLRYIIKENGGPSSARNRGITEASGEFIAFLDVDDLWPENNLNLLLSKMHSEPELKVVHGYGQLLKINEFTGKWDFLGNPKESFPGYIGAGLYKKEVFKEVGMFDTFLKFGEDADWFNRAEELKIPLKKLEEVTLYVRRHGKNMTEGKSLVELNVLQVFKKSLDRLRKHNPEIEAAMDPKKVSVIIPYYNAEKYLEEAIKSVLHQVSKPNEIILVDDGSTDRSAEIAESFKKQVKIIRQDHKGAAAARNLGVNHANGFYLAFLDADDLWTPNHLFVLLKAFIDNPGLELAFGLVEQFVSPELSDHHNYHINEKSRIIPGSHPGAMLVRKDVFLKIGFLNENLELGEFVDWFSKADDKKINQITIPEIIYKRRIHTSNQGILKKEHLKDYTKVIKEILERRKNG